MATYPYSAYQKVAVNPKKQQNQAAAPVKQQPAASNGRRAQASSQYLQNEVLSATPERLTLLLYDGAIRFMKRSRTCLEEENVEEAHTSLIRAQDIFQELISSLNSEYDLSENLSALYSFLYERLVEANIQKDPAIVDQAISLTVDLRDTWSEAMTKAKTQKT